MTPTTKTNEYHNVVNQADFNPQEVIKSASDMVENNKKFQAEVMQTMLERMDALDAERKELNGTTDIQTAMAEFKQRTTDVYVQTLDTVMEQLNTVTAELMSVQANSIKRQHELNIAQEEERYLRDRISQIKLHNQDTLHNLEEHLRSKYKHDLQNFKNKKINELKAEIEVLSDKYKEVNDARNALSSKLQGLRDEYTDYRTNVSKEVRANLMDYTMESLIAYGTRGVFNALSKEDRNTLDRARNVLTNNMHYIKDDVVLSRKKLEKAIDKVVNAKE